MRKILPAIFFALSVCNLNAKTNVVETPELWYEQAADEWMKSVPLGNGRLGAMVYGGVESETLALNESSMWSGQYDPDQHIAFGRERHDALRQLYFDGKFLEGHKIAHDSLRGVKHSFGTHLPIGDLKLDFVYAKEGECQKYRRSLDLEKGLALVTFEKGGVKYSREYFSSNPQGVLVFRLSADKPGQISFTASMNMLREHAIIKTEQNRLTFQGQALFPKQGRGGVHYFACIAIKPEGGSMLQQLQSLKVENADAVTIIVDVRTNYNVQDCEKPLTDYENICRQAVDKALQRDYKDLRREHVADFSRLFSRVSLHLGDAAAAKIPIDKRWAAVKAGADDPALQALFFQYGRYLLMSSSREDSPLPVALQGFFNDNLACNMPWTNDYHLDINTQQNYWISNVGNLSECNAPLYTYIAHLAKYGAITAQKVYGCRGWTAHTTANIWGFTAPSDAIWWGLFPTASSWLAAHLWTQYEYVPDNEYLRHVAYPLLKGNAEFLLDYMSVDPNTGYMVTGPSISPENSFGYMGGHYCAALMPTVDRVFAYEIFNACVQSSDILGIDRAFADSLRSAMALFPPLRVNKYGGLREWYEDYDDVNPNHRHTSHLHGFYPYSQITMERTPELAKAVENSLTRRLTAEGWEDVEWSRANSICYYARLKKAPEAYHSVNKLIGDLSRENLLTISAAGIAGAQSDIYAFDGNSAGAAGIAEMLVQCQEGFVDLLPCLPPQWKDGSFSGLCVKGGAEVSAVWKDAQVQEASLTATADGHFRLRLPQTGKYRTYLNGKRCRLNPDKDACVNVYLKKGDVLSLK